MEFTMCLPPTKLGKEENESWYFRTNKIIKSRACKHSNEEIQILRIWNQSDKNVHFYSEYSYTCLIMCTSFQGEPSLSVFDLKV